MDEIRERILAAAKRQKNRCAEFLRRLIRVPSNSRSEAEIARLVGKEMHALGYPSVEIDRFGNVIGTIGDGRAQLFYDAHLDTNGIGDLATWRFDPYEGETKAGKVYGHGTARNKAGLASLVYAGGVIHSLNLTADATVHIVGSVQAHECDGLAYRALLDVEKKRPHFVVLSAPTGLRIHRGHRGRAEIEITVRGQPIQASEPSSGVNCIYGLSKIVDGIQELNERLPVDPFLGRATVAVTHIESEFNGAGVLPEVARILVDRRLLPEDSKNQVIEELTEITRGTQAQIEVVGYDQPSYRGVRIPTEKFFPTWVLPERHPLIRGASRAYQNVFRKKPELKSWTGSTAGTYTMGVAEVPTIGFGPSEESFAGPVNDHVRINDLEKSIAFYSTLPAFLPDATYG